MTELLYYKDAYIKEFDATVLSVQECDGGFATVLDRTAFFPEEGGQYADTGYIGEARVIDAKIKDGVVYHITDSSLPVFAPVHCTIDFDERYEKMQCHSAEHLLSGLIHRHFGYDNVGFHLGRDYVTFDVSAYLEREQLDFIEMLANLAIYENREIYSAFPSADELSSLEYRAKLELSENVRIVTIDGYDACACCAPHVRRTGEIGSVKLLDAEKHKGGIRIYMTAGKRAILDYRARFTAAQRISALLSEPQATIADAVKRQCDALAELEYKLREARLQLARARAEAFCEAEKNAVIKLDGFSPDELREFSNIARNKVGGILVALSGSDGAYKYVMSKHGEWLPEQIKKINATLVGRGGGRGEMVQGSFACTFADIEKYFLS